MFEIELKSDLYGSEVFEYLTMQEAMDAFERLATRCWEEEAEDGVKRSLTLTIG